MANYDTHDILGAFDASASRWRFIVLDGGKGKPADVRITAYRDDHRWAVVLEELMFFPQSPGHRGIADLLYSIGNCVSEAAEPSVKVTADGPGPRAFLPPFELELNPEVRSIRIRDAVVPVDLSRDALAAKGIPITSDEPLNGQHLLWSLLPEYREMLLATEDEKRVRIPRDLPKFMQLDEWHHPALITDGLRPSDSETFQMLAQAIATGDIRAYRPTLRPNTHWKNWLDYERV